MNSFKSFYLKEFGQYLQQLETFDLEPLTQVILETYKKKKKIIAIGNGGGAANAAHFCTGLSYVTRMWENPIKTVNLTNDVTLLTSLANDHGFENIFLRQLQVLLEPGDVVVAFTASGNSKNLIKAFEFCRERSVQTVAFSATDGGALLALTDVKVHFPQTEKNQAFAEDLHMILSHLISYYLELKLK